MNHDLMGGQADGLPLLDEAVLLQNERSLSRTLLRIGLSLTVFALLPIVLSLGLSKLALAFFPDLIGSELYVYGQQVLVLYVITMPLCMLIIGKQKGARLSAPPASPAREARPLAMLVFFCIAEFFAISGNIIGNVLMSIVGVLRNQPPENELTDLLQSSSPLTVFLVVVLLGPVMEELLFRHVITRRLLPYGEKTAVLLSGLFFGLAHGNFYQLFYSTAIGMLFSFIYVRTGRLLYPILFHITFNFLGGFLPTLLIGMLPTDLSDPAATESLLVEPFAYILPLLLLCLYSLFVYGAAIAGLVLFCIFVPRLRFALPTLPVRPGKRALPLLNVGVLLFFAVSLLLLVLSLFT